MPVGIGWRRMVVTTRSPVVSGPSGTPIAFFGPA